jgi:hypothetical protein
MSLDNEFRCLGNGRSIKLGVGLSGTIASHKKLTLVVGMIMILDDFHRQWMLQKAIILFKEDISLGKGVSMSFFNFLVLIPYFSV